MDASQEQPQQQAADMAAPPADEIAAAMAAQMDPAMAAYEEGNPSDPSSHSRKKASQAAWRNSEHGKAYMKAYRSTPEAKQRDNMRKKMKRQSMKYGKDRDKRIIVAAGKLGRRQAHPGPGSACFAPSTHALTHPPPGLFRSPIRRANHWPEGHPDP